MAKRRKLAESDEVERSPAKCPVPDTTLRKVWNEDWLGEYDPMDAYDIRDKRNVGQDFRDLLPLKYGAVDPYVIGTRLVALYEAGYLDNVPAKQKSLMNTLNSRFDGCLVALLRDTLNEPDEGKKPTIHDLLRCLLRKTITHYSGIRERERKRQSAKNRGSGKRSKGAA